jgi:GT2 family glycosyltransferase
MKLALIICTYKRAIPLLKLLNSVKEQSLYPDEIIIVDGSPDEDTLELGLASKYDSLQYFKVKPEERGLTKQRNYGINHVNKSTEIISFLDDDTVLEPSYFEEVIKVFQQYDDVVGVGGVAQNENKWIKKEPEVFYNTKLFYQFEDYVIKEASRNKLRNYFGLQSNEKPGIMPAFSHGRTCGYPLNGQIHEVDLLIGMAMAFRRVVFENIQFSTYFEGYGLYEDADFSLRALQFGKNVIATQAKLSHYHDASGRPNKYEYGKMVLRNGYYVWRVKYPKPSFDAQIKWHMISFLLTGIRFTNIFNTSKRKEAFTETLGRVVGWFSLFVNKPI